MTPDPTFPKEKFEEVCQTNQTGSVTIHATWLRQAITAYEALKSEYEAFGRAGEALRDRAVGCCPEGMEFDEYIGLLERKLESQRLRLTNTEGAMDAYAREAESQRLRAEAAERPLVGVCVVCGLTASTVAETAGDVACTAVRPHARCQCNTGFRLWHSAPPIPILAAPHLTGEKL